MPKTYSALINEINLSRVFTHNQNRNTGSISAYRSNRSPEENRRNHQALAKDIQKAGFGFVHTTGRYLENHNTPQETPVDEPSILVMAKKEGDDNGELLNFLKDQGRKYDQDSILHKKFDEPDAKFHNTSDRSTAWPAPGETASAGPWKPQRKGEFHSILRNGKTYAYTYSNSDNG